MKFKLFLGILPLLITGCSNDIEVIADNDAVVSFTAPDFVMDDNVSSRTQITSLDDVEGAKFAWSAGDVLGVVPKSGVQASFPLTAADLKNSGTHADFHGNDWALLNGSYYAAYYPFSKDVFFTTDQEFNFSYVGQKQNGNNNWSHLPKFDYLVSEGGMKMVNEASSVTFNMKHIGCLVRITIAVPASYNTEHFTKLTIMSNRQDFHNGKVKVNSPSTPAFIKTTSSSQLAIDLENVQPTDGKVVVYAMMAPGTRTDNSWSFQLASQSSPLINRGGPISSINPKLLDMKAGCCYSISL